MKKNVLSVVVPFIMLSVLPMNLKAANEPVKVEHINTEEAAVLHVRLYQINAMDKSAISAIEKLELRNEVRSINETLREGSGGVYLSVGAVIIIILLLIILM